MKKVSYHLPFVGGRYVRSCADIQRLIFDLLHSIDYTFDAMRRPCPLCLRSGYKDREFLVKLYRKLTEQIDKAKRSTDSSYSLDLLRTLSISVGGFYTADNIDCRLYTLSLYGDGQLIATHFGDYTYIMSYVNSHLNNSGFITKYVVIS